jgi:hypothetical protein
MAIALLVVIGCVLVYLGSSRILRYRNVESWRQIDIEILDAEIGWQMESIRFSRVRYFYPEISYAYTVNGQYIRSDRVSFDKKGIWLDKREAAEKLLDEIKKNRSAFYNPRNIADSVILKDLAPKRISHDITLVISGLLLIFLGIYFAGRN